MADTKERKLTRDQLETAVRAAVSEIQRRNRERGYVFFASNGDRSPAITVNEMRNIIMQFLDSAEEGLG